MVGSNVTVDFIKYIRTLLERGYSVSFYLNNLSYGAYIEAVSGLEQGTKISGKTFFELEKKLEHFIDNELGGL